jgi:hypothetical protein
MNITVAKHGTVRKEPAYTVYVGRTRSVGKQYPHALHELGNPFPVGKGGTREEVIEKYRRWLWFNMDVPGPVANALTELRQLYELHGQLTLVCHCHPLPCHADVIKACLEWINSQEETNVLSNVSV